MFKDYILDSQILCLQLMKNVLANLTHNLRKFYLLSKYLNTIEMVCLCYVFVSNSKTIFYSRDTFSESYNIRKVRKLIAVTKMLRKYLQRHVVDFYISDFQSGLRALVKTGYGARVTPYVEESAVIDIDQSNKNMSSQFKNWLAERKLSTDDRVLRLKEGYGT